MDIKLKQLKDIISESCVTIILNTHRTKPDNLKDPLKLKNLVKEAENRLLSYKSKRDASLVISKINELADNIDHSRNLESLILFVNEDIAEFIRLPIAVNDRVIIDKTFATRDLVRALHQETNYYVLVLSKQKVRLIEAYNDRVVKEVSDPFPIENKHFFASSKAEMANASRVRNLVAEFFNRVDKELNVVRKQNPLPVLICSEETNYYEYIKIADQKSTIFETYLNKNRLDEKDHAIVSQAWEIIKKQIAKKNNERKSELLSAMSAGKVLGDASEIWKAIFAGRVQTIFIERGMFQPAIIENNAISFVSDEEIGNKEVTDDIYGEMIEANMSFGGDVVFMPKGELKAFNGFAATTRY